jgi:organic hydroperoxide reductase OsmC/OhrA
MPTVALVGGRGSGPGAAMMAATSACYTTVTMAAAATAGLSATAVHQACERV